MGKVENLLQVGVTLKTEARQAWAWSVQDRSESQATSSQGQGWRSRGFMAHLWVLRARGAESLPSSRWVLSPWLRHSCPLVGISL